MKLPPIDVGDVVEGMTMSVTVRGRRRFRMRLAIGCAIIRLAAIVIGMGHVDIRIEDR